MEVLKQCLEPEDKIKNVGLVKLKELEEKDKESSYASELGEKNHWVEVYKHELYNFRRHGDIGDIWFGEESMFRVIDYLKSSGISKLSSILDIGCGNGIFLSYVADEGFPNLFGVDYCAEAIALAKGVAKRRNTPVQYEVADILNINQHCKSLLNQTYDVLHDKGTFDAISISRNVSEPKVQQYIRNANALLKASGLFIITTCNWTEDELLIIFQDNFEKLATLPTPLFEFGGKIGSNVTATVLRKLDACR